MAFDFRTFVHPNADMSAVPREAGLTLTVRRTTVASVGECPDLA
jgi:hypothetical protein